MHLPLKSILAGRLGSPWTDHVLEKFLTTSFIITVPRIVERLGKCSIQPPPSCLPSPCVCVLEGTNFSAHLLEWALTSFHILSYLQEGLRRGLYFCIELVPYWKCVETWSIHVHIYENDIFYLWKLNARCLE